MPPFLFLHPRGRNYVFISCQATLSPPPPPARRSITLLIMLFWLLSLKYQVRVIKICQSKLCWFSCSGKLLGSLPSGAAAFYFSPNVVMNFKVEPVLPEERRVWSEYRAKPRLKILVLGSENQNVPSQQEEKEGGLTMKERECERERERKVWLFEPVEFGWAGFMLQNAKS